MDSTVIIVNNHCVAYFKVTKRVKRKSSQHKKKNSIAIHM